MNIQQAYTDWSSTYDQDRNLTRDLDEIVTRETLASLCCDSILEIGCGTGKNTALLAQIGQHVKAIDFSSGMIEKAREKPSLDNVTFAAADLTQPWPCDDQSIDLISCNLVLEHISEFIHAGAANNLALSEMKELWHPDDQNKPPRLVSFLFQRQSHPSLSGTE